jgi:hypothetical protein
MAKSAEARIPGAKPAEPKKPAASHLAGHATEETAPGAARPKHWTPVPEEPPH